LITRPLNELTCDAMLAGVWFSHHSHASASPPVLATMIAV
jgi:hypothetical protein